MSKLSSSLSGRNMSNEVSTMTKSSTIHEEPPPNVLPVDEAVLNQEAIDQSAVRGLWSKKALYTAFTWWAFHPTVYLSNY